jgi:hypothetical protein
MDESTDEEITVETVEVAPREVSNGIILTILSVRKTNLKRFNSTHCDEPLH